VRRSGWSGMLFYGLLAAALIVYLFPIYWTAASSLKPVDQLMAAPTILPRRPVLEHYEDVVHGTTFLVFMRNSLVVAGGVAGLTLALASSAAYSLSRFRYRGRRLASQLILLVYLFPGILLIIPVFVLMTRLGLYNSLAAVVVMHVLFTLPFSVWTLKLAFDTVPDDIEAAARVDGAGRLTILHRIYLPLATPALGAATIFSFITSWNEYLFASVLVADTELKTLPVGIAGWTSSYAIQWGQVTAASVLTLVPAVLFFAFLGRLFIAGLTAGAMRE
jgi:multiple sugar transport system permease protein